MLDLSFKTIPDSILNTFTAEDHSSKFIKRNTKYRFSNFECILTDAHWAIKVEGKYINKGQTTLYIFNEDVEEDKQQFIGKEYFELENGMNCFIPAGSYIIWLNNKNKWDIINRAIEFYLTCTQENIKDKLEEWNASGLS